MRLEPQVPRRRNLRGIAAGTCSSFASRNNDVDGYWALGVLYKVAIANGTTTFTLNLLSGEPSPKFKYAARVASSFRKFLLLQLDAQGFEEHQVGEATVELEFGISPSAAQVMHKNTWGQPFLCRTLLVDDLGKKHMHEVRGWCAEHDPNKERRSTRAYAS